MGTLGTSWQTEGSGLICRWYDEEAHLPYRPFWMRDASVTSRSNEGISTVVRELDFTRLSPFAGKGWFERVMGSGMRPAQ